MKTRKILLPFVAAVLMTAGTILPASGEEKPVYYVCGCADGCACDTISGKPGTCACGAELVAMRLLTVEKDIALFCRCGAECGCGVSKTDPDRCDCGKPLKKINVKGRYKSSGCLCSGLEYTLDL